MDSSGVNSICEPSTGDWNVTPSSAQPDVGSRWTSLCLRQADIVLLVGHAAGSHAVTDYERWTREHMSYAQNVLVLVHDMDFVERTRAQERKRCGPRQTEEHETPNDRNLVNRSSYITRYTLI